MIIRIDKRIYSDSCISKCVYALADKYNIQRRVQDEHELLEIQPLSNDGFQEESAKAEIVNTLNDFKLRCIIEEETKDIRTIIYAKAFADYTDPEQ